MSIVNEIIRLEPFGPAKTGMAQMQLRPEDFQSELPVQHMHVYYEDEALGLSVGVWDTTSMREAFGPYPSDEFMWVLEGRVCMIDGDGKQTLVNEGESFCIRNAIPISWKQEGYLRKFFMIYADPNSKVSQLATAQGGVKVLDPLVLANALKSTDTTYPFEIAGEMPQQRDSIHFKNDTGNMFVGMWDSTPFESEMRPFPCYEFVQLLEGDISVTQEDGQVHRFKAGDAFFIPKGTVCCWKITEYVRKFYSILDPGSD